MSYDLSGNKITLPAVGRIKDSVIEIVNKHNASLDDIQSDLNDLKSDVFGILGYNVKLTADASKDDTTLSIDNIEYATKNAKFTIENDDTEYTITDVDTTNSQITIDPKLAEDNAKDTILHIKSKIDPEELNDLFNEIEAILNKDGSANDVFDALIGLARAWNSTKKIVDTFEITFDSDGDLDVDLSNYHFSSADDYNIMISTNEDKPVVFRITKKDEKTATILPRDLRYFAEDNVKYDGSCDGCSVITTLAVAYNRNPIDFTLTDLDGNERSVSEG